MALTPIVEDLIATLRFYSRLPLPEWGADPHGAPDLDRLAYAVPLAGVVLGGLSGLVLVGASLLHLTPFLAATLAVATLVLATGALQEDGLADTADGFGGGRDRTRRLAIMRDSRIGSFGATALVLALILRVGALEALIQASGPMHAALALCVAAAVSRTSGILLLRALPPARTDGASAAVGQPAPKAALACGLNAALIAALILVPGFGVGASFAALATALLVLGAMGLLSARLVGGQTGDVAGATQQVSEIAVLLAVLIFAES
ncbi:adenosylcobinamide-GDP ribazoletransferase [Xanthobacter agilis]|uniref:Adenosylcobinamide-GDP ribazoletransferase n=1 Tax=Xanthobacter agilis TaxID=47492 RepID=A0ABU0LBA7_XANAG|nr:adenosylcobinamide-GDP ribazoletransferase [Xanthobacter agilis]MDQ0504428.1 adenosylcobinamide-GDP ribazoletransferase [Xanthobacter agilis]